MSSSTIVQGARAAGCGLLLLAGSGATPASAQIAPVSPRVQSFAGAASDGVACGAEALAANPAALARSCAGPTRMLLLPTIRVSAWASAAGDLLWENRSELLEPGSLRSALDPTVRREFLDRMGPEGLEHRQRLDLPVMQFSGRSVSGSFALTTAARGTIARDFAELVLEGHDESRSSYSIEDTRQEVESYMTLALGHGRTIHGFDVGVTANLMLGMVLTSWQAFDPRVDVAEETVRAELTGVFAGDRALQGSIFDLGRPDGLGAGLDLGVIRRHGPFRVGVAVQNVVQWSSWSDDLHTGRYTVVATSDSVTTTLDTAPHDPANATPGELVLAYRFLRDAHFPRRLRLSAAYEGARTSVGAGVILAGEGRIDGDPGELGSVGAEYRPFRALRLQTGAAASLDGIYRLSAGAGVRLRGLNIDGAVTRMMGEASGYTVGLGLSLTYDR